MELNKEKQIEEMARDMCNLPIECEYCSQHEFVCKAKRYAHRAIGKGYRKASDVIEETIDRIAELFMYCEKYSGHIIKIRLAELKKKYTEAGK